MPTNLIVTPKICIVRCSREEGDGFLLTYKRLETGKFDWSRNEAEVREMTPQQFRWLMEGLSIDQKKSVKKLNPERVL